MGRPLGDIPAERVILGKVIAPEGTLPHTASGPAFVEPGHVTNGVAHDVSVSSYSEPAELPWSDRELLDEFNEVKPRLFSCACSTCGWKR
jgi:hypothetical protein